MEAGVVIGLDGQPLYWHAPDNRSVAYLPDSHLLWEIFWEHRKHLSGFAHSHPGSGIPGPSHEDLTTFAAVESGLGKRLNWWIISSDKLIRLNWVGPEKLDYQISILEEDPEWILILREKSNYQGVYNG